MSITAAINASSTNEAFFVLLTITAGALPTLRVVNNLTPVTSRGEVFEAYPFSVVLNNDIADAQPQVTLTIDAVDQRIIELIRAFAEPPTVLLEMVLSGTPDVVDKSIDFLTLANVTYTALSVTGVLQPTNFLSLPAIASVYDGSQFPSLVWQ